MAAKNVDSDVIKGEELNDMTTCCICTEIFKDPKALPCIHTFCMKCLQETGFKTNKGPGDEMPCPICRRMFKIPTEGFHGLPKNFFIDNLIQVTNVSALSASSRTFCDACLDENKDEPSKEIPVADAYCVQCNQNFCEECCKQHRKWKLTKNHKLVEISEYCGGQNMMADHASRVCELHEQNELNVYCTDCKTVVCSLCFIDDHNNHTGSHVKKFVDGFRKQIEDIAEAINQCKSQAETKMAGLHKAKEDTRERVVSLECVITIRRDKLKELTDKHAASLLQSLCSTRQSKLKEIEMHASDIDTYLACLVTYNSQCVKVMTEGSDSDICRAFSDLSVKAVELQEQCQLLIERGIQSFNFCFRDSELEEILEECCDNFIGEFEEEGNPMPKKRSKKCQLAEQSNRIALLKKEIEVEKAANENLILSNEQFKINIDTITHANKALTEELDKAKANIDSRREKLKKERGKNEATISSLQVNNDKLKQELDAKNMTIYSFQDIIDQLSRELDKEKIAKISLQTDKGKLKQELDEEKATNNSLNASKNKLIEEVEKLEKELKKMKTDSGNKILNLEEKLKQEKREKEQLMIIHTEEKQKLNDKIRYNEGPVLIQMIRTKAAREGEELKRDLTLTILDKELFVASEESSEVEVYDAIKLSFSRRWKLKEIINPKDIVSCNGNKCLYIFDYKGYGHAKEILRVDANGNLIKNWSTGDNWGWGLSVTKETNVILSVFNKNKLIEYSSDGKLIRQINLSSIARICEPWHAIKLSNGDFVVSHGCDIWGLHRVCVVDANGKLKKSFGGKRGGDTGEMSQPFYLAVDRNEFVMVADRLNCRVLLLDSDLKFKRIGLSLSQEKHALQNPTKILLDESNCRLYLVGKQFKSRFGKCEEENLKRGYDEILVLNF